MPRGGWWGVAALAAAAAASALWGAAALYSLYTPLAAASAPGFQAVVALTWYRVEVLGHRLSLPALDRAAIVLFPTAAAAVYTLAAGVYASLTLSASLARRRSPGFLQLLVPLYTAAAVALASTGPLLAARALAYSQLHALIDGWRGYTNAGSIELYRPQIARGTADALLAGDPIPPLLLLAALCAAAAGAAHLAAQEAEQSGGPAS